MNSFIGAFIGVPQSQIAGTIILITMFIIGFFIIFSKDKTPISNKIGGALLIFLIFIPVILYILFQMTCIVTGVGTNGEKWWCGMYAWLISAIIIVYAIFIVVVSIMSIGYKKGIDSQLQSLSPEPEKNEQIAQ